ncbi:MAG: murein biosynthesis integral membrane protein MurJ [Hyphomicrobiales bacterium]|nr:murein biosynthesis integral membrane protein MurJ [Hyphomicrobiales bacterium]
MFKNLASVAGFTLLSRVTGFIRDVMLGAVLGAGALADAFYIAFRLPNHFRAIFGEGAFNAAYVPTYAKVLETEGANPAKRFSAQIFTLLLISQIVLLALALIFTRQLLHLLAPGFADDPEKMAQAIFMTRITFPYLLCVTLVTLLAGTLNAHGRFAAAAFAPVLLNIAIVAMLTIAFLFPNAGIAAAVGIFTAGILELGLMLVAAKRAGLLAVFARPGWGADIRQFFKAFLPAVIGSAGVQIAIFADTIIGSMLPTGGISSIYYADRLYQLPIGVIGIAAGTVLLPEMSRRFSAGDDAGALRAQNRTMTLTIALAAPFFIVFLAIPGEIIRGVFERGAFDETAAIGSAAVLNAYGAGLLAVVLIRSAVASFQARGDTLTPMYISLFAVACNVVIKLFLFKPLGAVGLALATAAGAWLNFGLLVLLAMRRGDMAFDRTAVRVCLAVAVAAIALFVALYFGKATAAGLSAHFGGFASEARLGLLAVLTGIVYFPVLAVLLIAQGMRPRQLLVRQRAAPHPDSGENSGPPPPAGTA